MATQGCPCGDLGHPTRHCRCSPAQVDRYRSRLSGPILDRIDLQVELLPPSAEALLAPPRGMTTDEARQAIAGARSLQEKRLAGREGRSNARIPASDLETLCATTAEARSLFRAALERHLVSARGYARCLRVARTIADLEGAEVIGQEHAAESLGYRNSGPAEGEADPNRDSGQNRPRAGPDRTSSGRIDHHNYLP